MITKSLSREKRRYQGTIAHSEDDRDDSFISAIREGYAGRVYPFGFANGSPVPIHTADGLARHWPPDRASKGRVARAKTSIVPGFESCGGFSAPSETARMSI